MGEISTFISNKCLNSSFLRDKNVGSLEYERQVIDAMDVVLVSVELIKEIFNLTFVSIQQWKLPRASLIINL